MVPAALRNHWGLDARDQELLQEGNGRQVWRVGTTDGAVVAKVAPAAPHGLKAMDQLARTGFPHMPAPRHTLEGATHVMHGRQAIWVMDWVDGIEPTDCPDTHRELGRIASMLNAVPGFTQPRAQGIRDIKADLLSRGGPGREYISLVEGLSVLEGEPEALVHGEINRANARLSDDGRIVVLDWDDLGVGVRWLEAGYPLIHVFLGEDLVFDQMGAAAYYDAYTGGAGFSEEECERVLAAATLHALRYLPWGHSAARWQRLLAAQARKAELLSCLGD